MFTHEFTRQSNQSFLNGYLSNCVEITSCVYTKTIIRLRFSSYCWTGPLLKSAFSLACLETRLEMRWLILHETGFTRQRFVTSYFILSTVEYFRIFAFYIVFDEMFLNWFSTSVTDDQNYVCGRRLYACIVTRKFKGVDSREITSFPEIKKRDENMASHFNHRRK